jgi:hypothetical protein
MKVSANRVLLSLGMAIVIFGAGILVGANQPFTNSARVSDPSFQKEMDAYCAAKLNDGYLSKLSPDSRKGLTDKSFFSRTLHTCVQVEVTLDPKNAGSMNYIVSDLTFGFIALPKWHATDQPLNIIMTDLGTYHRMDAEGYWKPVSSKPEEQPVSNSNKVTLRCDYTDGKSIDDDSNVCTETEAYTQFGTIDVDTQTYHIDSWRPDEVIATKSERGLAATTTTTLLIHPETKEIEVIDRTKMDDKQLEFFKGAAGKSFGDHFELNGGMYLFNTGGVFFQCDEDGVVTNMRLDVVQNYHGDVANVPSSEWNAGSKADHKFTQQQCEAAMQKKLSDLN